MNILRKIVWSTLLFLPFSCYEEEEPINTECGKDVFDIDMGGMTFCDDYNFKPAGIVVSDSVVTFSLYGRTRRKHDYDIWDEKPRYEEFRYSTGSSLVLSISFPQNQRKMDEFKDVVSLSHASIDFGKDSVLVTMEEGGKKDTLNVTSGLLRFNCADLFGIDGHRDYVVLAGTLSFAYDGEAGQDSIKSPSLSKKDYLNRRTMFGDFDVRIGRSNFDKKN